MQKVCIFDRVLCIIILIVSLIKMQTEYWCKLLHFVLSAVGKRVIESLANTTQRQRGHQQ